MYSVSRSTVRPKPEEILTAYPRQGDWYSIVICDLHDLIPVPALQVKLYQENTEDGGYQKTEKGTYITKYATEEQYTGDIALSPVYNFSTSMEIYEQLGRDSREAVDAVKALCNSYPTAYFWHNGDVDDACNFHGLHIHLLQATRAGERISTDWPMKSAGQKLKRHNITVRTQKVNNMDALTRHLLQQPRMLLGSNNLELCARIIKLRPSVKDDNYADIDFNRDDDQERAKEMLEGSSGVTNYLKKSLGMKPTATATSGDIVPPLDHTY